MTAGRTAERPRPVGEAVASRRGAELPPPPCDLLDGASLFLDLDGTLLDLLDDPAAVRADAALRALLASLAGKLKGRLAVVSGRSLEQIDAILGPAARACALSGSHGCEHRFGGREVRPERPAALDAAEWRLAGFAEGRDGVLVERKSFGVALHYRRAPMVEEEAGALAAALADELGLQLQTGKMMAELRLAGSDKGEAVRRLLAEAPMKGARPVFVGDDDTDEAGFAAARALGGHGVLVGDRAQTAADYRLADPAAVRAWLEGAARA